MIQDKSFVLPGDIISRTSEGLMRGFGVSLRDGCIVSNVRGYVSQIGQLISVTPITSIYSPNIGDIVVGRIDQVQKQRWKVQIGCAVLADLRLSAIFLPDGELRRRTTNDERNMRQYFDVGDLICAEVQQVQNDIQLHTREQHPKKLEDGLVIEVPSRLIKRVPNHICTLEFLGFKFGMIFGLNGSIWVSASSEAAYDLIPRIRQCILLLATYEKPICAESLCSIYQKVEDMPVERIVSTETAIQLGLINE